MKLKDENLRLLGDDVTEKLVKAHLGLETDVSLLKELALIDSFGNLTESGMKIASAYPFFGDGKRKRRKYPVMVFAFLLSSFHSSSFSDSSFFRKEMWTSLFPDYDKREISSLSLLTAKAMESLSIFASDGFIDRKKAEHFMSLSLHDRLSYVISAETGMEVEKADKVLYIVENINGLKKEDWDRVNDAIRNAAKSECSLTLLTELGLVYEEDGTYIATSLIKRDEGPYTLSSDFTITYEGDRDRDIYLVAEPVFADTNTTRWQITRESIKRAFDISLTEDEILTILASYSSYGVNECLKGQIESWKKEYNQIRIIRGTIVIVEERFQSLFTLPGLKEHVIEKLSEKAFLLDTDSSEEWMKTLNKYGVSMLGRAKGPALSVRKPREIFNYCHALENMKPMNDRREIPFDSKAFTSLLESVENPLEKLLIKSHLAFSKKEAELYERADGLDYQKKKAIITEALKNGMSLIVIYADDRGAILTPTSIDGDILETESTRVSISRIWEVASVPKGI